MKILIADDEILVRIGLKTVIEGFGESHEVIEACDGADALEKYLKFSPSLAFVDINMPRMDGLEFIEAARKEKRNTRFIILSCHSDFQHLRDAIKTGVSDYIIKTSLDNGELHEIIQETERLDSERIADRGRTGSGNEVKAAAEEEFTKAVNGMAYEPSLVEAFLEHKKIGKPFDVLIAEEKGTANREEPGREIETGINNTFGDMVSEYGRGHVLKLGRCKKLVILSLGKNLGSKPHKENLDEFCGRLLSCLKTYFNKDYAIAVCMDSDAARLPEAVKRTESTLKYGFYDSEPGYYFCDGEEQGFAIEAESEALRHGVDDALRVSEFHKISGLLDTYVEAVRRKRTVKVEKVIDTFFRVFYSITQYAELNFRQRKEEIIDSSIDYSYFLDLGNLDGIAGVIKSVVLKLIDRTTEYESDYYTGIIKRAKDYIDHNLEKEISLNTVAQYVNLSPSHFSKIFKDTYGMNFIDYCISVRVEKAKAYINEGMKVFVAAEKVGYGSYSYFSRLFKKVTGTTPEEYKKVKDKGNIERTEKP